VTELNTRVLKEARAWIGTPYRHQASLKGAGTDCLGLIRGVWREIYGDEPLKVPAYTADWSEPLGQETLLLAAKQCLVERVGVSRWDTPIGTVVVFRMNARSVAKHLGIISAEGDQPRFIHAYSGHGVVESPLSPAWARRIAAQFTFPERI